MKQIINKVEDFKNKSITFLEKTKLIGIDFSEYITNQNIMLDKLCTFIELSNKDPNDDNKYLLTPTVLNMLVKITKEQHKINDTLYDFNIDIVNYEDFSITIDQILSLAYNECINDTICSFLYDWNFCEKEEQIITWNDDNNQNISMTIRNTVDLCDFLCENKNYYSDKYYTYVENLKRNLEETKNISKQNFELLMVKKDFASELSYQSFENMFNQLKEEYFELTNVEFK